MRKFGFSIMLFLILFSSYECENIKVTFLAQWYPQAQFAGFYYAKEKGIYEKYGLDVEILDSGPSRIIFSNIMPDEVDFFTLFLSSAIVKYDYSYKIVNICQLSQKSGLIFVSKKEAGIESPADLAGKRIGVWYEDFNEIPLSFLRDHEVEAQVTGIKSSIDLFLMDGIDSMGVMWYNEYDQIYLSGIDHENLNTIFFSDYDYNIPEDGIYCSEYFYTENPQLCEKFVKASLEGWRMAFENKREALDIVTNYMKKAHVATNRAHQSWMLDRMEELFLVDDKKFGVLYEEDYKKCEGILADNYFLENRIGFDNFAKNVIED